MNERRPTTGDPSPDDIEYNSAPLHFDTRNAQSIARAEADLQRRMGWRQRPVLCSDDRHGVWARLRHWLHRRTHN